MPLDNAYLESHDHLGNVRTVMDGTGNVVSYSNYYAFGGLEPTRYYSSNSYRYGFNGKEKDDNILGDGTFTNYGAREYDNRIGRWFTIDPSADKYPRLSPYVFALNTPTLLIDPDGKDARVNVKHNSDGGGVITISSIIYITGPGANKFNATIFENKAKERYTDGVYVDPNGKKFTVKFDIKYKYAEHETQIQLQNGDNIMRYNQERIVSNVPATVKADKDGNGRISNYRVEVGHQGEIGVNDEIGFRATNHESLHLLGLSDRYTIGPDGQSTPDDDSKNDIMGSYYGKKLNQVHYDNYGKAYADKPDGDYILENAVDVKPSDGTIQGGSADGKRSVKAELNK